MVESPPEPVVDERLLDGLEGRWPELVDRTCPYSFRRMRKTR